MVQVYRGDTAHIQLQIVGVTRMSTIDPRNKRISPFEIFRLNIFSALNWSCYAFWSLWCKFFYDFQPQLLTKYEQILKTTWESSREVSVLRHDMRGRAATEFQQFCLVCPGEENSQ